MLEAALRYARNGWAVLPLNGKIPRTMHGVKDATNRIETITEWAKLWPDANIGVATGSHFFVLDVDARNGGHDSLEALEHQYGKLPDTLQQITGGGGRHYLFSMPEGRIKSSSSALGAGLDIKAAGGYVVVDPSIHPDTDKQYIWDGADEWWNQPIYHAPEWLLALIDDRSQPGPRPLAEKIPKGKQHQALVSIAGTMRQRSMSADEIFPSLWAINVSRCEEPGPEKNIRRIAESMMHYPPGRISITDQQKLLSELHDEFNPERGRPFIFAKDRHTHEITTDTVKALHTANNPPTMFRRGNAIVTVVIDEENKSPMIRDCSEAYIRGNADRAACFIKEARGRYVPAEVPREVIQDLMSRPEELPFPRLNGVFESPVAVDTGRVLERSGYDYPSGFLLVLQPGFKLATIPDCPTREDARIASEFIQNEVLTDFPFENEASRDNAMGALITVVARPAIYGPVPIGIIDATSAGTGKSLLNEVIAQIGTGRPAAMKSLPKDEEETRKVITSALMRNPAGMIVFDNLAGSISSAVLAQTLTSRNYQDRVLGSSRMVEIPNRCTWFANGNNVEIRGDIARRVYYIRLDSQCANPWLRNQFRHPNLLRWISENRGAVVAALLTMCKAWYANGRPPANKPIRLGSFEQWAETVGGILDFAGADQFMGNADKLYSSADSEHDEWQAFLLAAWREFRKFGALHTAPFTAAELVRRVGPECIPSAIAGYIDSGAKGLVSIGIVLKHRRERRFGEHSLRLCEHGGSSPKKWIIKADTDPDDASFDQSRLAA